MTDQEARDEREVLILWIDAWYDRTAGPGETWTTSDLADALLAAGYRKHPEPEVTDEMVERAARAMFEEPVDVREWTWADVVAEEPERAFIWRADARRVLEAAGPWVPVGEGEQNTNHYTSGSTT